MSTHSCAASPNVYGRGGMPPTQSASASPPVERTHAPVLGSQHCAAIAAPSTCVTIGSTHDDSANAPSPPSRACTQVTRGAAVVGDAEVGDTVVGAMVVGEAVGDGVSPSWVGAALGGLRQLLMKVVPSLQPDSYGPYGPYAPDTPSPRTPTGHLDGSWT